MKLMILGYARHGKDTACEMLRDMYGLTFMSSSWACAEVLMFPLLKDQYGYKNVDECFADRVNHRKEWFDAIAAFNTPDLTRLMRIIYENNDVYSGIRSAREFHAGRNAGLFEYAIWIDRSMHLEPEPATSNTIERWMADFIVDNNGDLDDLKRNLRQLMEGALYRTGKPASFEAVRKGL